MFNCHYLEPLLPDRPVFLSRLLARQPITR